MNEKLKRWAEKVKNPKILIAVGLAGIVLIALSSFLPSGKKESAGTVSGSGMTAEEYRQSLEERVGRIVTDITSDTNAAVVVTLDSGFRYSYADATESDSSEASGQNSEQSSNRTTRSYITVRSSDGGETALLVTEMMPQVRGVAIICRGGNDSETADKIRSAVMAALDLTSKRVYVTGGNSNEKR